LRRAARFASSTKVDKKQMTFSSIVHEDTVRRGFGASWCSWWIKKGKLSLNSGSSAPYVFRLRSRVHPPAPSGRSAEFQERCRKLLKQLEILNADRPNGFSPRMHHVASPKHIWRSFGNPLPEVFEMLQKKRRTIIREGRQDSFRKMPEHQLYENAKPHLRRKS